MRPATRPVRLVASVLFVAAVLTGCAGSDSPAPVAGPTAGAAPSPSPNPPPAAPTPPPVAPPSTPVGPPAVPPPAMPPAAPPAGPPAMPPAPPAGVLPAPVPTVPSGVATAWSDPALWGGVLPGADASVVIPAGRTVLLDTSTRIRNLTIEGTLLVAERDLRLEADWMLVRDRGRLQAGTPSAPRRSRLELVLTDGDRSENAAGMGTKFFGAMAGVVELHGARKTRWTRLDGTAAPGALSIDVLDATGWQVGDRIAIAPTDFDPDEREVRSVTAIAGRRLTLDSPLQHQHWGRIQTLGSTGEVMDQRAPVANLSSNIVIRGSTPSDAKFGGHVMFMGGAVTQLSNIEITQMGQRGGLGRYPIHWHLNGDSPHSYLADSAVHSNFQRGIVVHRANDLTIRNNVVFDTFGHMIFIESSNEQRNVFDGNLVMYGRPIPIADMNPEIAFEHRRGHHNPRGRISGFWISNQNQVFRNNHVAAIHFGIGYWFVEGASLTGAWQRDNDLWAFRGNGGAAPYRGPLVFENNVASVIRPSAQFGGSNPMDVNGNALQFDALACAHGPVVVRNFRAYKVSMKAIWGPGGQVGCAPVVDGLVTADVKSAFFNGEGNRSMSVRGGVLFGMTDNQPPGTTAATRNWYALWQSFAHFPDDLSVEPVSAYPNSNLKPQNDAVNAHMTQPGNVTRGQVFIEWSNVRVQGWPQ